MRGFSERLADGLRVLRGVRAVGITSFAPLAEGENGMIFRIKGREPAPGQPDLVARIRVVTPGYFEAVGTPLLRGRLLGEGDKTTSPPVALVDETLAIGSGAAGEGLGQGVGRGRVRGRGEFRAV